MDFDVFTLGEVMLRFNPPGYSRLEDTSLLEFRTGGAEANLAVGVTRLGLRAAWAGKLPVGPLGRAAVGRIQRFGVDTSCVAWSTSARMGLYFIEPAAPPRSAQVIYDRAHSAASTMTPADFDWSVLDRTRHVHLTGITPALSESAAATVAVCLDEARKRGCTVSFDVNYRARLWPPDVARRALGDILAKCDCVICPSADATSVFGIEGTPERQLVGLAELTPARHIALTCGGDGAWLLADGTTHHAPPYPVQAVDRIGAGDAFDAGLIWGILQGDAVRGLRYGMAMAALKHTYPGDEFLSTLDEVEALLDRGHQDIQR